VEWALWVSDYGEGFQPSPERREEFRDALRSMRENPPDIERWDVMEMALDRLLRDLYRDVSLTVAAELGTDPAATLREIQMAFRRHPPSSFSTPDLTAMVLRMAERGQVFGGSCIRPLLERGELDPSTLSRLDDAMLERAEEGKLYAVHVTRSLVPYLRATGRGAWRDAAYWLDRAERAGHLSLVAAVLPHLDPPPPLDEVRRALGWDISDTFKGKLRKAFDLDGD
jgi:hypothetical protein